MGEWDSQEGSTTAAEGESARTTNIGWRSLKRAVPFFALGVGGIARTARLSGGPRDLAFGYAGFD